MAGLAVALRMIPHYERHAAGWIAFLVVLILVCLAASVYLVYVLEIFKFKGMRAARATPYRSGHDRARDRRAGRAGTSRQTTSNRCDSPPMEKANLEHYHPRSEELYYFVSGSGRMRLGVQEAEVGMGDCVVIGPGTPAPSCSTPATRRWCCLCCCAAARPPTRTPTR